MNHNRQHWIDRFESGNLTEAESREFQEALRSDPGLRDAYFSGLLTEVALEAEQLPDPFGQAAMHHRMRWPQIAGIAAGIALLAAFSYMAGHRFSSDSSPQLQPEFAHVATITDADGIAEGIGLRIGQPLEKGLITLPEGSEIGIAMLGGARLNVRGPADLLIDGPNNIRLEKGRISTYAPPYAHGFTIDTMDGKIVDLGTRFVTATGTTAGTEIHVLEGLVEAWVGADDPPHSFEGQHAAIFKGGKLESTEFLAQRLMVPLDPVLPDRDEDGYPDVIEEFYSTDPGDASSKPAALRVEENFAGYTPGRLDDTLFAALGAKPGAAWVGSGTFKPEGLTFSTARKSLKTSGGALQTTGETGVGATLFPDSLALPPAGVTYVSFLMRNPEDNPWRCFAGLLLYQQDREELFVGKLSNTNSYGSRLKQSDVQDAFGIPMDSEPHLFVIRIDRTRLVTDVFVDPVPGEPEASASPHFRYHEIPRVDRIIVRSGSPGVRFPTEFDEIRIGLTWESVIPKAD